MWTEDFPEGEGGSAKKKRVRVREEGRLTKIPLPDGEVQRCYQKDETRTETETRRKETPMSGSAGPSPVRIIWPTSEGPYRNLAWKAAKKRLVKSKKKLTCRGEGEKHPEG